MTELQADNRLEALCDGVFAIAITLLILDVRLPESEAFSSTAEFWRALGDLGPSVFAFVLSFAVILITWVNHHAMLKLVRGTSQAFIYANGLLLLTVAAFPFPTTLLGRYLLSDHASPAVVVYNGVLVAQAIAWILLTNAAIQAGLAMDEGATATLRTARRHGLGAVAIYGALTIAALWLPVTVAMITTLSWMFWLVLGIRTARS